LTHIFLAHNSSKVDKHGIVDWNMDPRQREKLLAQIPILDLRIEAFKNLGDTKSVTLMIGYQDQLEQIRTEAETQVPAGRIYVSATAIGAAVGAGVAGLLVLSAGDEGITDSSVEIVRNGIEFFSIGGLGAIIGRLFAGSVVDRTKSEFIWQREDLVQERHREFLERQLSDDQVAALFLRIAAEE